MKSFAPVGAIEYAESMLWIYELKGIGRPTAVPGEDLEGIWPEPPFYYLFYSKNSSRAVLEWLRSNPEWRLTSRYDLPYEKWQDVSAPQISIGAFDIRLPKRKVGGFGHDSDRIAASDHHPAIRHKACRDSHESLDEVRLRQPGSRITVFIDPGVVFGSGLHPTTQGCLLAISRIFESNKIHTAVDFGAGTGVLATACALAGAKFNLAIDCNPLALEIARRNAGVNRVEDRIAFVESDNSGCQSLSPDLFIMNLEWPVLQRILASNEWRRARQVILAGFLKSRLEMVVNTVLPEFEVDEIIEREGWPTVTLLRKAGGARSTPLDVGYEI